jgi:hypothetical protein
MQDSDLQKTVVSVEPPGADEAIWIEKQSLSMGVK